MPFVAELEVRILNIDAADISKKIIQMGGILIFSGFQERQVFDVPNAQNEKSWLRLRSNDQGSSLTIKEQDGEDVQELEVGVSDYEKMLLILQKLDIHPRAHHQNHRSLYKLPNGIEISIDTWPQLSPFLEIEGESEEYIAVAVALLGFAEGDVTKMDIVQIYEKAGISGIKHLDLVFSEQERELLTR